MRPKTPIRHHSLFPLLHHEVFTDLNQLNQHRSSFQADETGRSLPGSEPETGSIDVQGSYTFVGDDGVTYSVSYQANEAGFQPQADFLPVAPAQIPEYVQLRQEHPELFWAETQ